MLGTAEEGGPRSGGGMPSVWSLLVTAALELPSDARRQGDRHAGRGGGALGVQHEDLRMASSSEKVGHL